MPQNKLKFIRKPMTKYLLCNFRYIAVRGYVYMYLNSDVIILSTYRLDDAIILAVYRIDDVIILFINEVILL